MTAITERIKALEEPLRASGLHGDVALANILLDIRLDIEEVAKEGRAVAMAANAYSVVRHAFLAFANRLSPAHK